MQVLAAGDASCPAVSSLSGGPSSAPAPATIRTSAVCPVLTLSWPRVGGLGAGTPAPSSWRGPGWPVGVTAAVSGHSLLALTRAGVQVGKGRAALLPRPCRAGLGGQKQHMPVLWGWGGGPEAGWACALSLCVPCLLSDAPPHPGPPGSFPDQPPWPLGWVEGWGCVTEVGPKGQHVCGGRWCWLLGQHGDDQVL